MAIANNSEGSSVPPEMLQNLEMEDDYSKLTPSADYTSPPGRNIFRNKKFTKKRHEPKARKTQDGQDPSTVNCSEEDEEDPKPKSPSAAAVALGPGPSGSELYHRSIPKLMMSINQTIKKMSIKDNGGNNGGGCGGNSGSGSGGLVVDSAVPSTSASCRGISCGDSSKNPVRKDLTSSSSVPITLNSTVTSDSMFSDGDSRHVTELEKIEEVRRGGCGRMIDDNNYDDDDDFNSNHNHHHHHHFIEEGATTTTVTEGALEQETICGGGGGGGSGRTCSLSHPQGKRRRHRRKQQYKRMAVDVQIQSEKCSKSTSKLKKVPTSNSSEDSGIGKRKRNIILSDNAISGGCGAATQDAILKASGIVPVPVRASSSFGSGESYGTMSMSHDQQWKLDQDSDAVMMDFDDDMEGGSASNGGRGRGKMRGHNITEEESGESDTQNDDVESLSDHNQDADDEESDYYNNDSSTTSLSESSFTILNPSKKFIPVHSREIRSGRRRLKSSFPSVENEEISKFLQTPSESILKMCASSEKERQDFMNVASLYSLSYEECQGHGQGQASEDTRMWVQFTKTSKTTTTTQQQRRNAEAIKAAAGGDRSSLNTFSEGSLAPLFDILGQGQDGGRDQAGENSDVCFDDWDGHGGSGQGNSAGVGGSNQLVNSKRIKKGC